MIRFQQIINGDSGLVARAKINAMLLALTEGEEGLVAVWRLLRSLQEADRYLSDKEQEDYNFLIDLIGDANNYTDKEVSKVYTYVDGIKGGAGGLIPDPSYDPSVFPADEAVTLIALGAGTYTHFTDVSGTPIQIANDNSITVFYRAANAGYWSYRTKTITPLVDGAEATALSILSNSYSFYKLTKGNTTLAPITTTEAVADSTRREVLSTLLGQYEAFMSDRAHQFYEVTLYEEGDICVKDRMLYQFNVEHQGVWNASDVTQISILQYIGYVKQQLKDLMTEIVVEYNVSRHHTRTVYDDFGHEVQVNDFNLLEAIYCVPDEYRQGGLKITFIETGSGSWITYQLRKRTWSANEEDWKCLGNLDNTPDYFRLDDNGDIWGEFKDANTFSRGCISEDGDLVAEFDEVYDNEDGDLLSNILTY